MLCGDCGTGRLGSEAEGEAGKRGWSIKRVLRQKFFGDVSRLRRLASIIVFMFVIIDKSITHSFC